MLLEIHSCGNTQMEKPSVSSGAIAFVCSYIFLIAIPHAHCHSSSLPTFLLLPIHFSLFLSISRHRPKTKASCAFDFSYSHFILNRHFPIILISFTFALYKMEYCSFHLRCRYAVSPHSVLLYFLCINGICTVGWSTKSVREISGHSNKGNVVQSLNQHLDSYWHFSV